MIYEESTPDPNPLGSAIEEEHVEEIPMEDMLSFMRNLNNPQEEAPAADDMLGMFNVAKGIIDRAVEMNNEGPEGNTPLAALLNNEVLAASLTAVMMAPQLSDYDKIRFLASIVIVGCKEYNIQL